MWGVASVMDLAALLCRNFPTGIRKPLSSRREALAPARQTVTTLVSVVQALGLGAVYTLVVLDKWRPGPAVAVGLF